VDSTSFNPFIAPLAASTSSTDRHQSSGPLWASSRAPGRSCRGSNGGPPYASHRPKNQPPPRKPTTWRDAYAQTTPRAGTVLGKCSTNVPIETRRSCRRAPWSESFTHGGLK
jgi:hypothetical protein